jgi:hypothetical protein
MGRQQSSRLIHPRILATTADDVLASTKTMITDQHAHLSTIAPEVMPDFGAAGFMTTGHGHADGFRHKAC